MIKLLKSLFKRKYNLLDLDAEQRALYRCTMSLWDVKT